MKNFVLLSNITGLPDWLFVIFFLIGIVIVLLFYFGMRRLLKRSNIPPKPKKIISAKVEIKDEKLSLIDFCVKELKGHKFNNSEEVTYTILKEELIRFYPGETLKPVIVNDVLKLGEDVFKKLKEN